MGKTGAVVFGMIVVLVVSTLGFKLWRSDAGVTELMKAAKSGDLTKVNALVDTGADLDGVSDYGWTALMFACWRGHEDVVKTLLDHGANPNIKSSTVPSGFETVGGHPPSSALQEAISNAHIPIAKILIEKGAILDPSSMALAAGRGDISFLEHLDSMGATWTESTGIAFYPTPLCAAARGGQVDAVSWLLEKGVDINQVAVNRTALRDAVRNDEVDVVKLLLVQGADPNLVFGSTDDFALFSAVTKRTSDRYYQANLAIIDLLLEHGADRSLRSYNGRHSSLEFAESQLSNSRIYYEENGRPEAVRASMTHREKIIELLRKE